MEYSFIQSLQRLEAGKKVYFASDFHLGIPSREESFLREQKIIRWLEQIEQDAQAIFLCGDIFDFWFEYKYCIPKGFIRFQGKLATLVDRGIPVIFFTGNHDMWMFDYFEKELNIPVIKDPISIAIGDKKFHIGHGDGLGPGDHTYKMIKKIFSNPFFQRLFSWVHPTIGMGIANSWSRHSRITNGGKEEFLHENEWLLQYCKQVEASAHHDFYIFGHRHLPLELQVDTHAVYYNLGEWVYHTTYLEFDGHEAYLKVFQEDLK